MSKRRRFVTFVIVGILVEAVRLTAFWLLNRVVSAEASSLISLPIGLGLSMILQTRITWADVKMSRGAKFLAFAKGKGLAMLLGGLIYHWWWTSEWFNCPLRSEIIGFSNLIQIVSPIGAQILRSLADCGLLSQASLDLTITLTIGFLALNHFLNGNKKSRACPQVVLKATPCKPCNDSTTNH